MWGCGGVGVWGGRRTRGRATGRRQTTHEASGYGGAGRRRRTRRRATRTPAGTTTHKAAGYGGAGRLHHHGPCFRRATTTHEAAGYGGAGRLHHQAACFRRATTTHEASGYFFLARMAVLQEMDTASNSSRSSVARLGPALSSEVKRSAACSWSVSFRGGSGRRRTGARRPGRW